MSYSYPLTSDIPISFVDGILRTFGSAPGGVNPIGGHTGEDRAAPIGTPVYSPCDGIVVFEQFWETLDGSDNPWLMTAGGGLTLGIDAGETEPLFIMAHLSKTLVNKNQWVKKGQLVAITGNTGRWTTGPHLHFEVMPPNWNLSNGTYGRVNPAIYCKSYPDTAGSIGPAGDIIQEDELSAQEVDRIIAAIENIAAPGVAGQRTAGPLYDLVEQVKTLPANVWKTPVTRDGQKIIALQELADAKTIALRVETALKTLAATVDGLESPDPVELKQAVSEGLTEAIRAITTVTTVTVKDAK